MIRYVTEIGLIGILKILIATNSDDYSVLEKHSIVLSYELSFVQNLSALSFSDFLGDYIDRGPASRGVVDRLLGATTPIAASVELQDVPQSRETRPVSAIEIRAGGDVELLPSRAKLRLAGVKKALSAYDTFPMTLIFEKAGRIEVEVLVEEGAAETPKPHAH